ncbi:hypothetical protein FWH30_01185 [Microgenomates group bacterium]|nr:hypothetical protein [Microgenomates group bacterium]
MAAPQLFLLPKNISHSDFLLQQALSRSIPPASIFPCGILVDDIRELISLSQTLPSSSSSALLLPNLEMASISAQNALLKILEEPPSNIHFFLATSNLTKILPTIQSRVHLSSPKTKSQSKIPAAILNDWQFSVLKTKSAGAIVVDSEGLLAALVPLVDAQEDDTKTALERNALHLFFPELVNLYRLHLEDNPALAIPALDLIQKSYQYLLANVSPKLVLSDLFLQISSLFDKINP